MKTLAILLTVCLLPAAASFAQNMANMGIAVQRAKELSNQNNVRQGVAAPAPALSSAQQTQATAAQQNLARLRADLAALQASAVAKPEQKQQLIKDLTASALGGTKPSAAAVSKLAEDLAAALPGKTLAPAEQSRLAQDLTAMLNSTSLGAAQKQAILDDLQATLQVGGSNRKEAVGVGNDLKLAAADLLK